MACPYLSVLTVSSGRRGLLLRQAEALRAQSLPPERFEWVVCLNGPGGGPDAADEVDAARLEALELPFALKLVELPQRLPAGAARNACAQRTCGSILLFSDDDCSPAPDALARHVARQEAGLCVSVGGIDFEDGGTVRRWRPRRAAYWHLNGANCAVAGVHFRAVGGFDEQLAGYGGEDLELGYRLARAGVPFRALPNAVTVHLGPDPRAGGDADKARAAGANAARLARRHPRLRWRLGLHPLQVAAKRALLGAGLGRVLEALGAGSPGYEGGYLDGAADEAAAARSAGDARGEGTAGMEEST